MIQYLRVRNSKNKFASGGLVIVVKLSCPKAEKYQIYIYINCNRIFFPYLYQFYDYTKLIL